MGGRDVNGGWIAVVVLLRIGRDEEDDGGDVLGDLRRWIKCGRSGVGHDVGGSTWR